MRLVGQIHITVRGDVVRRDPSFWERMKGGLGGQVNLETGELQNQLEATAVVDAVRRALGRLGVDNALSLVIDETVIFQDADGRAGDLPDLVLALSEHASVFGRGFRELRFAAEHDEAGVHLVVETRARTRHRRDEPAAVVSVGGRIRALEPMKAETADAYRARVAPLTEDKTLLESARLAFESFVTRLQQALAAAMPEADVRETKAEAHLVKAEPRELTAPERAPREPMHPAYDPFAVYYPSPMGVVLDAMILSSMMHMMMPPPIVVMNPLGAPVSSAGAAGDAGDAASAASDDAGEMVTAADESSDDQQESAWDSGLDYGGDDGGGFGDDDF